MQVRARKPLGAKAYGSIPHLPGSRLGEGDHHCQEGQARIATERVRDKHDLVTVTVKLDGSCMAVARVEGQLLALGRAGYLAASSPFEQHHLFADWVDCNRSRFDALAEGERVVGEWLAQAHGTRYALWHEPFCPFDLMVGQRRMPYEQLQRFAESAELVTPALLRGPGPAVSIDEALPELDVARHGEIDAVEGAVWRVERRGEFDFMVKFVRHDKVDGLFRPESTGSGEVWNWRPSHLEAKCK